MKLQPLDERNDSPLFRRRVEHYKNEQEMDSQERSRDTPAKLRIQFNGLKDDDQGSGSNPR